LPVKEKTENDAKMRELDADIQTRGKAKFEMPPRPTPRTPATTTGAITVPSKSVLESTLKKRNIKLDSPEWKKVMSAAGYE